MTARWAWRLIALVAVAAVGGYLLVPAPGGGQAAADAVATVALGDITETVTAQGKLEAKEYVDIGAQVSGQLQKILVRIGDDVKAGQLLAQIDPRIFQARVEADEAGINNLKAQQAGQRAQSVFARQLLERNQALWQGDGVSLQALQESEFNLKRSVAAEAALEAQIQQLASNLSGNRTNLAFTRIYAPITGTVVAQTAREGQTLIASLQTPTIMQLANLATMTVRAQVAEADILRLRPGMPVRFTTLAAGERRWQARVGQLLPTPEVINNVVLYNVLVDVDNPDRQLMVGMTAQLFFILGEAGQVPLLPVAALGARLADEDRGLGKAYRVRVVEGRQTRERTVHIGLRTRRHAQVLDGLKPGDQVLLERPEPAPPATPGPRP